MNIDCARFKAMRHVYPKYLYYSENHHLNGHQEQSLIEMESINK